MKINKQQQQVPVKSKTFLWHNLSQEQEEARKRKKQRKRKKNLRKSKAKKMPEDRIKRRQMKALETSKERIKTART